jgi:TRAP-type uncharacterized transport system substrate-binding protein
MKALKLAAFAAGLGLALGSGFTTSADAETRVTYKSAKAGSSYFQMAVQIAEAMKAGSDGRFRSRSKKARARSRT